MLNLKRFKLTTECGYHWNRDYLHHWKRPRFRLLQGNSGIAFGPVMFFWDWE